MTRAQKNGRITFDGQLNQNIRRRIRDKRLQLGLPYRAMALFFNRSWSTIRKWECGPTTSCSVAMRPKLEAFLNGECDEEILRQAQAAELKYSQNLPTSVHCCMDRISNIYSLLQYHPVLRDLLLRGMEQVSQNILQHLVNADERDRTLENDISKYL